MLKIEGFLIDPPADFTTEEMTVGLRQQAPSSSSLIVQSKKARAGATLDQLATETVVELTQSLTGMKNLTRTELIFADGGVGAMLSYDWTTANLRRLRSGAQMLPWSRWAPRPTPVTWRSSARCSGLSSPRARCRWTRTAT